MISKKLYIAVFVIALQVSIASGLSGTADTAHIKNTATTSVSQQEEHYCPCGKDCHCKHPCRCLENYKKTVKE